MLMEVARVFSFRERAFLMRFRRMRVYFERGFLKAQGVVCEDKNADQKLLLYCRWRGIVWRKLYPAYEREFGDGFGHLRGKKCWAFT